MNNKPLVASAVTLFIFIVAIFYLNSAINELELRNESLVRQRDELTVEYFNPKFDCTSKADEGYDFGTFANEEEFETMSGSEILNRYSCLIGGKRMSYGEFRKIAERLSAENNTRMMEDRLYVGFGYLGSWNDGIRGATSHFDASKIPAYAFGLKDSDSLPKDGTPYGGSHQIVCENLGEGSVYDGIERCRLIENETGSTVPYPDELLKTFEKTVNGKIGEWNASE